MIRGSHALLSQVTDKTCFFLLNNIKYQFTSKLSIAIRIAFLCPFATWENLESGGCVIYMRDLRVWCSQPMEMTICFLYQAVASFHWIECCYMLNVGVEEYSAEIR